MKKLFLLLAVGVSINAMAQTKEHRALDAARRHMGPIELSKKQKFQGPVQSNTENTAGKGTDGATGEWFCFSDAIIIPGISEIAYWPIYPDSNIHTGNFNWYLHGIGTSFDPTSAKLQPGLFSNPTPYFPQPQFIVSSTDAYTIDSIGIIGWYERYNFGVTDTLNIYVVASGTPGSYAITWSFTDDVSAYWDRPDSQLQIGSPIYDWQTNSINVDSVPNVKKITKILDNGAFADSTFFAPDNTHLHIWDFAIPGSINVAANQIVTAFVAFGSATAHPLGTPWDNVNKWSHATVAVNGGSGIPQQSIGDYNGGIGAFSPERYHIPGEYWDLSNGSAVLAPTYTYTPVYMSDPWFSFFVKCPTCDPVGVNEVEKSQAGLKVYPNPANEVVNIAFTADQVGSAKIIITNAVGQVIDSRSVEVKGAGTASFSTANMPEGVYFYNVEINGKRTSTQFVVAH